MTPHINAAEGKYADTVLMPGDPKRAEYIANTFLKDVEIVNTVRGNYGYTGTYNGKRVSVQASGMGQPSVGIYATELFNVYNVDKIIRVGTCGAFVPGMMIGDSIVAMTAATDSNMSREVLPRFTLSPCASYGLLNAFVVKAVEAGLRMYVGQITSNDSYYQENPNWWKVLASQGVLGVDMETHVLYHIANKFQKQALTVNMVSDSLVTKEEMSPEDKEVKIHNIAKVILDSL